MATQKEIEYVLHLKTIMPDIIFTGKNKEVYEEFLKSQEEEYKKIMGIKEIKKVKQVRKQINPELKATENENNEATSEEIEEILHDLQDSKSKEQ